jgi:hypothetical protein
MAAPQTLIVFAGNAPSALDFARETDLDLTQTLLLPDESLATATRFNATTCPRVFVVDSRGRSCGRSPARCRRECDCRACSHRTSVIDRHVAREAESCQSGENEVKTTCLEVELPQIERRRTN